MKWISAYVASCLGSQRKSRKTRWVATRSTGWLLLGQHEQGLDGEKLQAMNQHGHTICIHIFIKICVIYSSPSLFVDEHQTCSMTATLRSDAINICCCSVSVTSWSNHTVNLALVFWGRSTERLTVAAQGHILSEIPASFLWSMSSPLFSDWGEMEPQNSANLHIPDG